MTLLRAGAAPAGRRTVLGGGGGDLTPVTADAGGMSRPRPGTPAGLGAGTDGSARRRHA